MSENKGLLGQANQEIRAAIDDLADRFRSRLVSGYVIGSLAHGGFEPAVSDVDVAVLLDACTSEVPEQSCYPWRRTRRSADHARTK